MTDGPPISGWCSTGHHPECPRVFDPWTLPDPAKPGTFYITPRQECECSCHNRVESEIT